MGQKVLFPFILTLTFLAAAMCAQSPMQEDMGDGTVELAVAFSNLSFTRPVDFQAPDDDGNLLFVLEQAGVIRVFENQPDVTEAEVFLDIRSKVRDSGNEEGLLGLAFHPNYSENGTFFVDYTASNPRRTVVARYQVDPSNPLRARVDSEEIILEVEQPYGNHNAGQIVFGPDGYLYVTMGDGGSGGDPQNNGQDRSTLLGSILRIDVDASENGLGYAIPPDNPFAGNTDGYREEIYAYGLRNPWRISFDPQTDRLWAADVGQNAYEEIDVIEKGGNYGWNVMEGFHCFKPASGCDTEGLIEPVVEYDHGAGRSVTGGFVYRGGNVPALSGKYVYADYVSGRIWTLDAGGPSADATELFDTNLSISSFGVDREGELYLLAFDGNIYWFTLAPSETGG